MNGNPISTELKTKWSALTDGDLEGIAGKKVNLIGKLQERYGIAKEQAEREADEFVRSHPEMNDQESLRSAPPHIVPRESVANRPVSFSMPAPLPHSAVDPASENRAEAIIPAPGGYTHSTTLRLRPRAVRLIAPLTVTALIVLLFFPWTGAYPAGYPVYTQTAFQSVWGGVTVDIVGKEVLSSDKPYDKIDKDPLMLFYILLLLVAVALVAAPIWLSTRLQKQRALLGSLARRRLEALATVAIISLSLLVMQMQMGFGFESAVTDKVDRNLSAEFAAAKTPQEREKANIQRALELAPLNLRHTSWLQLAICGHVLLLAGVGLELWLRRRGDRPLPRLDGHA